MLTLYNIIPGAYLIIVSNACNGVGVLFSSRHTFFQGERKRDCFKQSLFREKKHIFSFLCDQIHHTKHQMLHLMYHIILNPKDTKWFTLLCRKANFVANLRTFLAYFFRPEKYVGVPKMTIIRYVSNMYYFKVSIVWKQRVLSRCYKDVYIASNLFDLFETTRGKLPFRRIAL